MFKFAIKFPDNVTYIETVAAKDESAAREMLVTKYKGLFNEVISMTVANADKPAVKKPAKKKK